MTFLFKINMLRAVTYSLRFILNYAYIHAYVKTLFRNICLGKFRNTIAQPHVIFIWKPLQFKIILRTYLINSLKRRVYLLLLSTFKENINKRILFYVYIFARMFNWVMNLEFMKAIKLKFIISSSIQTFKLVCSNTPC